MSVDPLCPGSDGQPRCRWCTVTEQYQDYHDREWGFPVADDTRLFEKICLEGFQSGLSWRTILAKRERFRQAFEGFEMARVARFGQADVQRLLGDAGIVRHRGKIEAAIHNAGRALELRDECGSLAAYFWRWEGEPRSACVEPSAWTAPSTSPRSLAMSADLRRRGWKFVGPTTAYAFMQAMGLVNDHAPGCVVGERVELARRGFTPPR